MCSRQEHRLKLGGRQINALLQHMCKISSEPGGITLLRIAVIFHRAAGKEHTAQGTDMVQTVRLSGIR